MAFTKITPEELRDKGVIGLPDAPELNTTEMQEKFDEIALDVIVPHFNDLVDELDIEHGDVSEAIEAEEDRAKEAEETLDGKIDDEIERATLAEGELSDAISSFDTSYMKKSVYDSDSDGVVDNSEALEGHNASYFATASALDGKVDKVAGKDLSTNDFTTTYKNQIDTNTGNIGNLSNLTTTAKDNLVEAINEAAQGGGGGASDLDDLNDVNLTNPSDGQVLKYNATSSKWENGAGGGGGASTLSDLTDTAIATPSEGQVLQYGSNGKWVNGDAASAISNLTDVSLSNLSNGQGLKYNSTSQKWENGTVGDMAVADYAKNAFPNVVERSMATQLLYGNYDDLTLVGYEAVYQYGQTFNYSFVFPGNSYTLSDQLVCLTNSIVDTEFSLVDMEGYEYTYTDTNGDEITMSTSSSDPVYIISENVPSDCDVTKPFTFTVRSLKGPVLGLLMIRYKCSDAILDIPQNDGYVAKFFMNNDGTLGYYDRINHIFKTVGGGGGGGNPILPINPTDPTYKSTPGAIWIET